MNSVGDLKQLDVELGEVISNARVPTPTVVSVLVSTTVTRTTSEPALSPRKRSEEEAVTTSAASSAPSGRYVPRSSSSDQWYSRSSAWWRPVGSLIETWKVAVAWSDSFPCGSTVADVTWTLELLDPPGLQAASTSSVVTARQRVRSVRPMVRLSLMIRV